MKYTSITIEGSIMSGEILDRLSEDGFRGQGPKDFGFTGRVRDEIAQAWADSKALWGIFKRQMERQILSDPDGTTRTRNIWIVPFLEILGYELELNRRAPLAGEKTYAISHRAGNRTGMPVHVTGFAGNLDKKTEKNRAAMSPHSLVQEFLNLREEYLYALVTNGLRLRLLRDASRLIRLSYVEFDLERMMEEDLYADFAVLFRLLHASRMAADRDNTADCFIEHYHQDSLEDGSRIRSGLAGAVEKAILTLAKGFLSNPENGALCDVLGDDRDSFTAGMMYHELLILIYRILFLLVIEERDLIYDRNVPKEKQDIYYSYYSVIRARRYSDRRHIGEEGKTDQWIRLKQTFRLFEANGAGKPLGIRPLGGDIFGPRSHVNLCLCALSNNSLAEAFRHLSWFRDPVTGSYIRVNYGSLNVEEFGSVYEGLLEYDPIVEKLNGGLVFNFKKGQERSVTGSHYTPEELTQPLIRHSLDHIIRERLTRDDPEAGLLSIRVCDAACGSGHILLSAARRIALELARVRTRLDQPSPTDFRHAVRDVIRNCIYGVDKNPHAVELCKVSLWLEAHNPGQPLSFIDHRIRCGDSIVGLARSDELAGEIPDQAYSALPRDDRKTASLLKKRNSKERTEAGSGQGVWSFEGNFADAYTGVIESLKALNTMPETTSAAVEAKKAVYLNMVKSGEWKRIKTLADIKTAPFFFPKNEINEEFIPTTGDYHRCLARETDVLTDPKAVACEKGSEKKRFFHWFLEFPEVMASGGFDCILGNPPFLGNRGLRGAFGKDYLEYLKVYFKPAGAIDLVGYFFRRAFSLIRKEGYLGLISTNTIAQGGTREGSLEVIENDGGTISFAVRSTPWPGVAAVSVSLLTITKGTFKGKRSLDGNKVDYISTYLDDAEDAGNPYRLLRNADKSFQGAIVLGKGFILSPEEAEKLIRRDPKNKEVISPYLNGEDLNSRPDQSPSRYVINFFDWQEEKAREYPDCYRIVEERVKPERSTKSTDVAVAPWWQFWRIRSELYNTIRPLERVLVVAQISRTVAFAFSENNKVFDAKLNVFAFQIYCYFAFLQSSIHYNWAWKYCTTMKMDLTYTPTRIFETFPFPAGISLEKQTGDSLNGTEARLEAAGRAYHEHRKALMLSAKLGLTKLYNQFHNEKLPDDLPEGMDYRDIEKRYGKETQNLKKHLEKIPGACSFRVVAEGVVKLRELHTEMDREVLSAYGWDGDSEYGLAVDLKHGFYEVEYLPENDRTCFTICPVSRKEILKRLLALNHSYHAEEFDAGLVDENGRVIKGKKKGEKAKTKETMYTSEQKHELFSAEEMGELI